MNKENTSIKILSLDGGGIKGSYVQLIILQEIEKICKIPIKKLFNFIIGTSTGAILGSNITYDKPNEVLTEFNNSIIATQNVFKKINICNLLFNGYRVPLNEYLNNRLLCNPCLNYYNQIPDYANLYNDKYIPYYCNIICRLNNDICEPYIIRNYNIDNEICKKNNIKIQNIGSNQWNLLDQYWATTAVPTYIKEFTDLSDNKYIDYSYINTNPLLLGIQEVLHVFPKENIDLIVSIGHTNIRKTNYNKNYDLCYWLNNIFNLDNKNSESENNKEITNIYINNLLKQNDKIPLYIRLCPDINYKIDTLETDPNKIILLKKNIKDWISDNQEQFIILKNFFGINN